MEEIKKKKGRPKKVKEEVKESDFVKEETTHISIIKESNKEDLPFPLNFVKNVYDLFIGKK
jgi:SepF-like predicted cell division protein (DUF552 family)